MERSGRNLVDRINKCRRCMIDVTDLLFLCNFSVEELGGSSALASLVLLDVLGR